MSKNKPTPKEDVEFMERFIEERRWKTARTYSKTAPHSYTIRDWIPEKDDEFVRAVEIIRTYGYPERYWKNVHWYYQVGDLKYWTMGNPMWDTIVINRANVETTYGNQDGLEDLEFPRHAPF